jgi:hypothetical protein
MQSRPKKNDKTAIGKSPGIAVSTAIRGGTGTPPNKTGGTGGTQPPS